MLNVQQITATLARLGDRQLQQYAAMHKNDPYIISLALGESNRRKQMRDGAHMQAGPQPKIVDQAVASMAAPMPEEVGIGQLPAPNIAKMAGGGIVAFGDGGEVPRYNGMGGSFVGPTMSFQQFLASQGITPSEFANAMPNQQQTLREAFKSTGMGAPSGIASAAPAAASAAAPQGMSAAGTLGKYLGALKGGAGTVPLLGLAYQLFGTSPEEMATLKKADAARLGKATSAALQELGIPEGSSAAPMSSADVDALANPYIAPAGATPDGNTAPVVTPQQTQAERLADLKKQLAVLTGGAKPAGGGGLPDLSAANLLKERDAMIPKIGVPAPIQSLITEYEDKARQAKQSELDEYSAYLKDRGPAFANREKRLQERGERLSEQEKQLMPMSLLEAGLAIMGGTSPRALENLAKGQKGVESYKSGLEKLGTARDKLDDAFGQIEEFRRNEANMDEKEIRRMKAEINQTAVEAKKLALNAGMENFKLDKESANQLVQKLYQAKVEIYKEGQQNARTQQMLASELLKMSQDPSELRYIRGLSKEDEAKLARIAAAKQEPRSAAGLVAAYAKNPMALKILEQSDPALAAQIRREMQTMLVPQTVSVDNPLP